MTFISVDWFDIPRDFRCGKTFDIRKDGQSHIKIASKNFSITCDVTLETFDDDQLMVFFDTLNTSGNSWMELHDGNTSRSPNIGGNISLSLSLSLSLPPSVSLYLSPATR